jgi:hypothetical protein
LSVAQRTSEPRRAVRASGARWKAALRVAERWAAPLAAAVLIAIMSWPFLLLPDSFGGDWRTHSWYVAHQMQSLLDDHVPTLFLNVDNASFYPHYAFYGGTLYALAGLLSIALGGVARNGYVAGWILASSAGYVGWAWLGRMAGLGRWTAQVPAVVFLTSPYLVMMAYVRGDWPEYVAVSSMPLLAASAVSVVRSDRLRPLPMVALAGSAVTFSGSHNITLLWGSAFFVLLAAALCACVPAARRQVSRRGVLRLLGVLVSAVMVNAWFLLPDVAYQAQTQIAQTYDVARGYVRDSGALVAREYLLGLSRRPAQPGSDFVVTLPVLAIAWALAAGALAGRRPWGRTWLRVFGVLAAVAAAFMVVMTHVGLLLALPKPFVMIQFGYRLESYILLAICGGVLAGLVLLRHATGRRRWWPWALVPVLVWSVVGGVGQVGRYGTVAAIDTYRQPIIGSLGDFADASTPEIAPGQRARVTFPLDQIHHDRVTITATASPGQLLDTDLIVMPALIHVEGARIVGSVTAPTNTTGLQRRAVLQVDRDATPGAARITVGAAHPPAVAIGRLLSVLGLVGLLAGFVVAVAGAWRTRRGGGVPRRPGDGRGR